MVVSRVWVMLDRRALKRSVRPGGMTAGVSRDAVRATQWNEVNELQASKSHVRYCLPDSHQIADCGRTGQIIKQTGRFFESFCRYRAVSVLGKFLRLP
jgi:hypothetical protein